jgi:hypothetical protein
MILIRARGQKAGDSSTTRVKGREQPHRALQPMGQIVCRQWYRYIVAICLTLRSSTYISSGAGTASV